MEHICYIRYYAFSYILPVLNFTQYSHAMHGLVPQLIEV